MRRDSFSRFLKRNIGFARISLGETVMFASQLAVMLRSGLSIIEALAVLKDETSGHFQRVLKNVLNSVSSGSTLSNALESQGRNFPPYLINIIRAGEISGSLEEKLLSAAEQLKRKKELREQIRGAMFYPMLVLFMSFILGAIIFVVVLPKVTPIFHSLKVELPASTRALIKISTFFEQQGYKAAIILVVIFLFLSWLKRLYIIKRITHYFSLHLPLIKGITRSSNLSTFSSSLSSLLKSGISIDEALLITKDTVNNLYYQKAIDRIARDIKSGNKLSVELAQEKNYFPRLAVSLIKVGEKSGRLEEALSDVGQFYEEKLRSYLKMFSSSLEPALLIIVGLVVAWLAIAIITPIYEVTSIVYR